MLNRSTPVCLCASLILRVTYRYLHRDYSPGNNKGTSCHRRRKRVFSEKIQRAEGLFTKANSDRDCATSTKSSAQRERTWHRRIRGLVTSLPHRGERISARNGPRTLSEYLDWPKIILRMIIAFHIAAFSHENIINTRSILLNICHMYGNQHSDVYVAIFI